MRRAIKNVLSLALAFVMTITILPTPGTAQQISVDSQPTQATEISDIATLSPNQAAITEVIELREENVKHFNMGNGTYQAVAYSDPVHELDIDGKWKTIDNNLILSSTDGITRYTTADGRVSFSRFLSKNKPLVTIHDDTHSISISPASNQLSTAAKFGVLLAQMQSPSVSAETIQFSSIDEAVNANYSSRITYNNVADNTSLEYIIDGSTIKENIIVSAPSDNYVYAFSLALENLTPQLEQDGSIGIYDSTSNKLCYAIPAPYMYDTNFNMSEAVSYQLTGSSGRYTLKVSASEEWINAAERVFPVKIDPTVTRSPETVQDAYIDSDNPNEPKYLTSALWVRSNRITYIKTSDISLPTGATLQWANLQAYYYYFDYITSGTVKVGAYQVLNNWNQSSLTWNSTNSSANHGISTSCLSAKTAYGDVGATTESPVRLVFDITGAAQSWIQSGNNFGIALKYNSGSNLSVVFKSYESGSTYNPRFVYQYTVPGITLELQYDGGYVQRYTNAVSRINSQASILISKYRSEFGLEIILAGPTQIQSHADTCSHSSYNQPCECSQVGECTNDPADTVTGKSLPHHHKNIYKIISLIPGVSESEYVTRTKIVYIGHDFCYRDSMGDHISSPQSGEHFFGVYNSGENKHYGCVFDRVSDENDDSHETMTLIHEFGHHFGAVDHYSTSTSNATVFTTADMNAKYKDKNVTFSDYCIYGANFTSDGVISALPICQGCRYLISEGIKKIPAE